MSVGLRAEPDLLAVSPEVTYNTIQYNMYEGRSINKLQNSTIPLILKYENPKCAFCRKFSFEHTQKFFDDDVIIVTSSVHRTQSICALFSPPVFYHNSQVINSIGTRKNE